MVSGRDSQKEILDREEIYLGLGANTGDRRATITKALCALTESGVVIESVSPIYETEPIGVEDQPWFLNLVVRARSALSAEDVLAECKRIETELGRRPGVRFGPRPIDIDILLYGRLVSNDDRLSIPHPRMRERRFVLVPLMDIAPDLTDPRDGARFAAVLAGLDEEKKVTTSLSNES